MDLSASKTTSDPTTALVLAGQWPLLLWRAIRKYWLLIAALAALGLLLAAGWSFVTVPLYEAQVVLVPAREEEMNFSPTGALGALIGNQLPGERHKQEALAILRSRDFTEAFIRDLGLLPILFSDDYDIATSGWMTEDVPTLQDAFLVFDEDVRRIGEDLNEGTVTLSIRWRDRNAAAQWANLIVERLNTRTRERAISEASSALKYLSEELQTTNGVEIRQAVYSLIEDNMRTIALANARKQFAFDVIDPAVPADEDAFVYPKRLVVSIIGAGCGFLLGLFAAVILDGFRALPREV